MPLDMLTVLDASFLNFALYSHFIILFTKAVLTVPDESLQLTNGKPTRICAMPRIDVCRL